MKKVLIVTLYGEYNYGNKLQNYAMQSAIEKLGFEVNTLDTSNNCSEKNLKELVKKILKSKRINAFKKFSKSYLKVKEMTSSLSEFDFVCIGSDQIWNPNYYNEFNYSFGEFSQNSFSYAASFGIDTIPEKYVTEVKKGLEHLKYISVREEQGKKIVEEITGRNAIVNVDPTMLLTKDEWDKLSFTSKCKEKDKYILTYFLGNYSKERKDYIKRISNQYKLKIIDLNQLFKHWYYSISPVDFLYYIKNSELVLTDSFHGAVFSIMYKKAFYLMEREEKSDKLNSRIETLLEKFQLTDRVIKKYGQPISFKCDYSKSDEILKNERANAIAYLENALGIIG